MLNQVVAHTARRFQRAIVMPNLRPPVTTVAAARAYRDRIQAACPADLEFTPLMTAYLTDSIAPAELETGFREGVFAAAKLYPVNATTNSAAGVTDLLQIDPVQQPPWSPGDAGWASRWPAENGGRYGQQPG